MKKKILFIALACVALSGICAHAANEKHVILITIDGFRPDFYREKEWQTPNLHKMVSEGTSAYGVNSVFPSITYPSHTTIVTGVQPASHGVFYNGMFEPDSVSGKIYWDFNQITAPTLWQTAKDAGMRVTSLNWPVSAEAPVLFNIPDIGGRSNLVAQYAYPEGILDTLKNDLFHTADLPDLGKDQNSARIAAWVIGRYRPNFMTIHLFSVDHFEHMAGRHGAVVESAIEDADEGVGIIRKAIRDAGIEDSTLLIVTGDHGFGDVSVSVQPNVWLAKAGLLENPNGKWKARFHAAGGSTFLFLKDKRDTKTLNKVKSMLAGLSPDEKKYLREITPAEMEKIGADPNASFALSALNGASFGNGYKGEAINPGKGGTHGYYPDFREIQTGFLCVGRGVKEASTIQEMNLRDITAIVLKYLDLQMPSSQGEVPSGLFE
jgi:predicted AlkP superfamily pyrophosphatase or phosphodiesterase